MKKVFLDTNVMIDIIGRREKFCTPSLKIMSLADRKILSVYVSAMSYATAGFILGKENKSMDIFAEFLKFSQITYAAPVDSQTISDSLKSEFKDFEDAMQYYSALSVGADYIITRNKKDFTAAQIPVFEPQEFIDYLLD